MAQAPLTAPTPGNPYKYLLSPIELGPRIARNRIWQTAHATEFATDGTFADASVEYYGERARGGVAAITMEAMAVHPTSQPRRGVILAYDRRVIESYKRVAAAVQPHGTLLIAQLWHRGRQTDGQVSRMPTWAPSAVPDVAYREVPHAMTVSEIDELVDHYVLAAQYAIEGGVDGIEIHGVSHGYLINQFLSPATNHRTDEYGGSLENRMRLLRRIVDAVRAILPADRVFGIRVNSSDGRMEGGLDNEAWTGIARVIASWGVFHYMSTTQGTYMDFMSIFGTSAAKPTAYEVEDTARLKSAVGSLPVIAVGRITTPEIGEEIIASGKADMIGMARQLIADPMWVRKAEENRSDDIRPCVGANWCVATQARSTPLACIHNPQVGRERQFREMSSSTGARRLAVVGGGPGGMRAALTASERGHDVTIFEQFPVLGGQVNLLAQAPTFREWTGIVSWLEDQLRKTDVDIRLNHKAELDDLRQYDAVIVATGSVPVRHGWTSIDPARWSPAADPLPGSDQWNVFTPADVLSGDADMPRSVLILDDTGDRHAFAVAEYLADRRHPVHVVTAFPQIGHLTTGSLDHGFVYGSLRRKGVTFQVNTSLREIDEDVAILADTHTGEITRRPDVDAVVLSIGNRADDTLARALEAAGLDVVAIGDCQSPRRIFNAIWEGEMAGRRW
ncbi:FAD-dependent oxidoreductase (plasmid) [Rhodococcus sp. USK10]|uniref:oxidoreductase n=1 Tax=Rhodococcus sp. USK10 TaxID=2789739 RepID=UPI001C601E70|nr:FAD-dependent oxidoreductase [Rhodococcus sp. USK10]QYB00227.1 FAD-dependent oxidoreductase [Rhodococcus sp. USK10]